MKILIVIALAATLTGYILFPMYTLYAFIAVCTIGLMLGLWNTFSAGGAGASRGVAPEDHEKTAST
jgi:hypothetical protein